MHSFLTIEMGKLIRNLPPFMVHMVIVPDNQLRERHEGVSGVLEGSNQRFQRLRGIFSAVVAEDDAAVSEMLVLCDGLNDGIDAVILPVQGINICNRSKYLLLLFFKKLLMCC